MLQDCGYNTAYGISNPAKNIATIIYSVALFILRKKELYYILRKNLKKEQKLQFTDFE